MVGGWCIGWCMAGAWLWNGIARFGHWLRGGVGEVGEVGVIDLLLCGFSGVLLCSGEVVETKVGGGGRDQTLEAESVAIGNH